MSKTKWYLTTGRESEEVMDRATRVIIQGSGIRENHGLFLWTSECDRTYHRLNPCSDDVGALVAYTFGETVESKQCQKS